MLNGVDFGHFLSDSMHILHNALHRIAWEGAMLLRFGLENYRSFKKYTEVSFVATRQRDEPNWRIPTEVVDHGLLPVLAIYGANASGKSNVLSGLAALLAHVRGSFEKLKPGDNIPWTPWQLEMSRKAPPTRLDVDFLVDGVRYHYGFLHNAARFEEEWLYRWPKGTKQVLFHRDQRESDQWFFGRELRGARKMISSATRTNALFLSAAAQFNHDELGRVAMELLSSCRLATPPDPNGYPVFGRDAPLFAIGNRQIVRELLEAADLGIKDFRPAPLPEQLNDAIMLFRDKLQHGPAGRLPKRPKDADPLVEIRLKHGADGHELWELDPQYESQGTHALLVRLNDLLPVLREGGLMIIDEIEASMHTDLCAELLALFTSPTTNQRGAQLLFTTHDRSLLAGLRRDEVLLVDKRGDGESSLRTAADFRDLRGRDDLTRAYEQGRIGGVPVLGDITSAIARLHHHGA